MTLSLYRKGDVLIDPEGIRWRVVAADGVHVTLRPAAGGALVERRAERLAEWRREW